MLKKTYDKVCELFEEGNGYLPTRTLLNNKITTIQIRTMLQEDLSLIHIFLPEHRCCRNPSLTVL